MILNFRHIAQKCSIVMSQHKITLFPPLQYARRTEREADSVKNFAFGKLLAIYDGPQWIVARICQQEYFLFQNMSPHFLFSERDRERRQKVRESHILQSYVPISLSVRVCVSWCFASRTCRFAKCFCNAGTWLVIAKRPFSSCTPQFLGSGHAKSLSWVIMLMANSFCLSWLNSLTNLIINDHFTPHSTTINLLSVFFKISIYEALNIANLNPIVYKKSFFGLYTVLYIKLKSQLQKC